MKSLDQLIQRGLAHLHGLKETATVQLLITEHGQEHSYLIALTHLGAFLEDEPLTEPTLSVTIGFDSFLRIADASYSPLQAYLDGQLKLRGDLELAQRIAAKLTSPVKTRDSLRNSERMYAEVREIFVANELR